MEYIEVSPLPEVCQNCGDRRKCLEEDGCEWCCDACDYLGARFVPAPRGICRGGRLCPPVPSILRRKLEKERKYNLYMILRQV